MILPRGLVAPFALLVALVTATAAFTQGVNRAPGDFVGGEEIFLVGPPDALVGRSSISQRLSAPLASVAGVEAVSPETFVLTVIDGRSTFVRGVDFEAFLRVEGGRLVGGEMPDGPREALAGVQFARTFHVGIGDSVLVPAAFSHFAIPVAIVGVVRTDTPADDELLVPLDAASALADVGLGQSHVLRVRTSEPANLSSVVNAHTPSYSYSDVRISTQEAIPGQTIVVHGNVTNWGRVDGVKSVEVRVGGSIAARENVTVPARQTVPFSVGFQPHATGELIVTVNPSFSLRVRDPDFDIILPQRIERDESFVAIVLDHATREPVAGAKLVGADQSATTNASGEARLVFARAGPAQLVASAPGRTGGIIAFDVVPPRPLEGSLSVLVFEQEEPVVGAGRPFHVRLVVVNDGAEPHYGALVVREAGVPLANASIGLDAGERGELSIEMSGLDAGDHVLTLDDQRTALSLRVYGGPDPEVAAYLEARGALPTGATVGLPEASAEDYVTKVVGNITVVMIALSILAALLAGIGLAFVLVRHVAEAEPKIGILRAFGAPNAQVISLIEREVALRMAAGAAIGIAAGVLGARLLAANGVVRAFGHAARVDHPIHILLTIYVIAIGGAVTIARTVAAYSLRTPVDHQLRGQALRPLPTEARELGAALEELG